MKKPKGLGVVGIRWKKFGIDRAQKLLRKYEVDDLIINQIDWDNINLLVDIEEKIEAHRSVFDASRFSRYVCLLKRLQEIEKFEEL